MQPPSSSVIPNPLIRINSLQKTYPSGGECLRALAGLNLEVPFGEFLAVLGPSGCGKSTLLSILGLLETHDSGEYLLAGTSVAQLNFNQRAEIRSKHIGFIFQAFHLVGTMSVLDNVQLPLRYHRGIAKNQHHALALEHLDRVGLAARAHDYPHQLSGGQQQRVAIARAMVHNPSLILADEPTGNLDSAHAREILDLLKAMHKQGASILMVTHDATLSQHADRRILMHDGSIVEDHYVA